MTNCRKLKLNNQGRIPLNLGYGHVGYIQQKVGSMIRMGSEPLVDVNRYKPNSGPPTRETTSIVLGGSLSTWPQPLFKFDTSHRNSHFPIPAAHPNLSREEDSTTSPKDGPGTREYEPSKICLAEMVQNSSRKLTRSNHRRRQNVAVTVAIALMATIMIASIMNLTC